VSAGIEQNVNSEDRTARFEQAFLPHLHAAHNLARWLARNAHDAEDLVQEAYLRAFEHYDEFRGQSARAWLLTIVRNTFFSRLRRAATAGESTEFDEQMHTPEHSADTPETLAIKEAASLQLADALRDLPEEYREVIVLRELEEMSYKEIAGIAGVPLGTVMSRLARARERLRHSLTPAGTEAS